MCAKLLLNLDFRGQYFQDYYLSVNVQRYLRQLTHNYYYQLCNLHQAFYYARITGSDQIDLKLFHSAVALFLLVYTAQLPAFYNSLSNLPLFLVLNLANL